MLINGFSVNEGDRQKNKNLINVLLIKGMVVCNKIISLRKINISLVIIFDKSMCKLEKKILFCWYNGLPNLIDIFNITY